MSMASARTRWLSPTPKPALQDRNQLAGKLRQIIKTNNLPVIAGKAYITEAGLAEAGIAAEIDWALSSHTPVSLISTGE